MKRLSLTLLLLTLPLYAQNVRFGPYPVPSVSPVYPPLLQANLPPLSPVLAVCHSPANQVPCTNFATTFTGAGIACPNGAQDTPDPNAGTSACQSTGDSLGNVAWWAPSGTYDFTVCIGSTCSLWTVSQGGTGSGSGVTGVTIGGGLQLDNGNTSVGLIRTCSSSQILQWTGTAWGCATLSGGGNVSTAPGASQNIVQPTGTTLSTNSLSNITVVTPSDNWIQSPSGSLSVGSNTVTLTPCPRGILTPATAGITAWYATPWTMVHIAGTGTPEDAAITATTCTQGGGSNGTITFTATNSHSAGFTVQSSSQGVQEAINAAMQNLVDSGFPNALYGGTTLVPPLANALYNWTARVTIPGRQAEVDFTGGARTVCSMHDTCLFIGDPATQYAANSVVVKGFHYDSGVAAGNYAAVEDNGQSVRMVDFAPFYYYARPGGSNKVTGASFGAHIQIDNDQSAVIDHFDLTIAGTNHCSTDFCTVIIKGAGGGGNAGITWLKNSALNMGCSANGIDNQNGNTMRISDSVVQSQAQFAVRSSGTYSNVPNIELDDVYFEVAGCANSNPLGIGEAGLIVENGFASVKDTVGPVGSAPLYANTGSTQYNYYIIAHSSTQGYSAPFLAGIALTNGSGSIPVLWSQFGTTGTITYDVIRTSGPANTPAPYTAICTGGSTTTCGSVATGLTVGSTCAAVGTANICTFNDTASTSTSSYTLTSPAPYFPAFGNGTGAGVFWPGSVVVTATADSGGGPSPSGVHFDRFGDNVAPTTTNPVSQVISSEGPYIPHFFAQQCVSPPGGNWISCIEGNSSASSPASITATLLDSAIYNGPETAGTKGRLILENGPESIVGGEKITIVDSNGAKTLATGGFRPTADANDTYIGLDNALAQAGNAAQMAFGAPTSISNYIGSLPNNSSYLERLTSSLKTFTVPITTNSQVTSTLAIGTAPLIVTSTTPVANLTLTAHPQVYEAGVLTASEKVYTNTQALTTGAATHTLANSFTFTSSATFGCTCTDQTAANACKAVPASATTVTLAGTGSDTLWLSCSGH
jgi:hypothetical protein